ncbi:MAG TPA: winged helix-turn-helix domain-containing protein [Solirubrobacteraceae bacterium]|nr:winged helix-turn-helix domain-containing protein [Solirubrobacteraceae bacterium]
MYLATRPHASNREIAGAIGMSDEAQVSRRLARMQDLGLIDKGTQYRNGAPNAWQLTRDGLRLVHELENGPAG